jgi:hypothetical protein
MRRKQAPEGGRSPGSAPVRFAPILLAGCVGYLLGSAHLEAFRATDLSAAQSVALRFPQDWRDASRAAGTALRTAAIRLTPEKSDTGSGGSVAKLASLQGSVTAGEVQDAFFDPAPMAPGADQSAAAAPMVQTASAEDGATYRGLSTQPPALPTPRPTPNAAQASQSVPAAKITNVVTRHPANERPGYMLNDAQIASIKQRLHLTPDQEQMWPAVEAALRNIAYSRAQQARLRGAAAAQTAAIDPNAVQGLKSAAVPLILSFNSEQKEEVRNIVHVMGLDQLASQF